MLTSKATRKYFIISPKPSPQCIITASCLLAPGQDCCASRIYPRNTGHSVWQIGCLSHFKSIPNILCKETKNSKYGIGYWCALKNVLNYHYLVWFGTQALTSENFCCIIRTSYIANDHFHTDHNLFNSCFLESIVVQ